MRPNLAAEKRRTPKKSFSGNEARAFVRAFLRLHFIIPGFAAMR
jgi:hypothetical protein